MAGQVQKWPHEFKVAIDESGYCVNCHSTGVYTELFNDRHDDQICWAKYRAENKEQT